MNAVKHILIIKILYSNILLLISLKPCVVNLIYLKLKDIKMKNQSLRQVIHILIMIFFYKDIDLCIIYTQIECLLQIYIEICQWITKQIVVCQRDSCQMHRQIDYRDGWIEKQIKIEIEIQIDRQIDRQTDIDRNRNRNIHR